MKLNFIRRNLYNEIYLKHSQKSKIAKEMNYQPIYNWKDNPYIKFKYYIITELAALISYIFIKFKFNPNIITSLGIILTFISIFFLSSNNLYLNLLSLMIFFLKNIFDYADGFVARKLKKTSNFGAFFDEWSGEFILNCFYISVPMYVYNKTNDSFYLYLTIFIVFIKLINPKNKILSENYLKKINHSIKNKIIILFKNLTILKNKKKIKSNFVLLLAEIDYSGRTRYTDFIIFLILLELYFSRVIVTNYICIVWLIISVLKNLYFFKKLKHIN
jgi:hypothetical protein